MCIRDRFILSATYANGQIVTESGIGYKALILPSVKKMPLNVLKHISNLAKQGAKIVFLGNYPADVPGFAKLKSRQNNFSKILKKLAIATDFSKTEVHNFKNGKIITGSDYKTTLEAIGVKSEEMITKFGLHAIRRTNAEGYHYFISALHKEDIDGFVTLSIPVKSAVLFNPMTGETGKAAVRQNNGKMQVWLQLKSGESIILKTFTNDDVQVQSWKYLNDKVGSVELSNPWKLHFAKSEPQVKDTFTLNTLKSWTELPNEVLKINSGTGIYTTTFQLDNLIKDAEYVLSLGDVRESARVYVNGQDAGTVWAAPFECKISKYLKTSENILRVEVTNLPANRIADYDRRGVEWRIFNEINFVDRSYKKTGYGHWQPMESGLCSPVKIEVYK
jgi:hypothetical protein